MKSSSLLLLLLAATTTKFTLLHAAPFHKRHPSHHLLHNPIQPHYRQTPHDTALYDVLHVRPDATAAEIAKSYRRLCLQFHPDKIRPRHSILLDPTHVAATTTTDRSPDEDASNSSSPPSDRASSHLHRIAHAHRILSDDRSRLLYHRYGIRDGIEGAMRLLSQQDSDLGRLLGYPPHRTLSRTERVHCILGNTVEKLRPLVEGTVEQESYVQSLYDECARWKQSALGKHILRCVGRAYRREGYRVLRTMQKRNGGANPRCVLRHRPALAEWARDSWRDVRHVAEAAVASGKVAAVEAKLKQLQRETEWKRERAREAKKILERVGKGGEEEREGTEHSLVWKMGSLSEETDEGEEEAMFSDDENMTSEEWDDDHFERLVREKTYNALLSAHQTEVLWKLTKMDLDSTIREACRKMLAPTTTCWNDRQSPEGWYSFFPSENSPYPNDWHPGPSREAQDGWVGLDGNVVSMQVGRLRAAAALVLVGDIMLRCGKDVA